jgi:hypothetical protein
MSVLRKPSSPEQHSSFLSSGNDDDIDLFCQLEDALQSDSDDAAVPSAEHLRSDLQAKFLSLFRNREAPARNKPTLRHPPPPDDDPASIDEILQFTKQLQESHRLLKRRRADLDRDRTRFQREKRAFARERARLEQEQIFADSRPPDAKLRAKYDRLKAKYQAKKTEWSSERALLIGQIEDLRIEGRAKDAKHPHTPPVASSDIDTKPTDGEELSDSEVRIEVGIDIDEPLAPQRRPDASPMSEDPRRSPNRGEQRSRPDQDKSPSPPNPRESRPGAVQCAPSSDQTESPRLSDGKKRAPVSVATRPRPDPGASPPMSDRKKARPGSFVSRMKRVFVSDQVQSPPAPDPEESPPLTNPDPDESRPRFGRKRPRPDRTKGVTGLGRPRSPRISDPDERRTLSFANRTEPLPDQDDAREKRPPNETRRAAARDRSKAQPASGQVESPQSPEGRRQTSTPASDEVEPLQAYPVLKRNIALGCVHPIDTAPAQPLRVIRATIPSPTRKAPVPHVVLPSAYGADFDYDPGEVVREVRGASGKTTQKFADGSTGTVFANGTKRIATRGFVLVVYANGDVAKEFPDGAVAYRYAGTGAVETTLSDGTVFIVFANRQKEKHTPAGEKIVDYPNGAVGVEHADGSWQLYHPDGTVDQH